MSNTNFIKVNLGCGEQKLPGFINVDVEASINPDLVHDIKLKPFPWEDDSVEEFFCIHNLEHIEFHHWSRLFHEIYRVLKPEGTLVLGYPEFEKCAQEFLTNKRGQRDFFRAALYGRQAYPGDYHVTPVVSTLLVQYLKGWGFKDIKYAPEELQPFNTILKATKGYCASRQSVYRNLMTGEYEFSKESG